MTKNEFQTREQWLEEAVKLLTPLFQSVGDYKVPRVRVACGWPSSRGISAKNRTVGECWPGEAAADGVVQIFISPYLVFPNGPQGVLEVLVHEIVHAVVGCKEKHNKVFKKCATAVGLEGKMMSTNANAALCEMFKTWATTLGDYPHSKLDRTKSPTKKQTTRMIKMECSECGYVARTSQKWIDAAGPAHCPLHGPLMVEEKDEDEDECPDSE